MRSIKLDMPASWSRNKAWMIGKRPWIVAAAFNPYCYAFGIELLAGYGKGLGLVIGPLWVALAYGPKEGGDA